jgi:hypothetical protein
MDGVEASTIIAATLNQISDVCQIKRERLREMHRPILLALQKENAVKIRKAEAKGYERGKTIHIRSIIEAMLKQGSIKPDLIADPQLFDIHSALVSCANIAEIIVTLDEYRSVLKLSYGLSDDVFNDCVKQIAAFMD